MRVVSPRPSSLTPALPPVGGRGNNAYHPDQGAALIFALGALTLLFSLASAFILNMTGENRQTEDFVRSLEARLAAQAGLERAIAELKLAAESNFVATAAQPWYWRSATQPSYARAAGAAESGLLGSGARYTLKIVDAASRIHINDENPNLAAILEGFSGIGSALSGRMHQARTGSGAPAPLLPHRRYATKSQVKAIPGVGTKIFDGIKDFVTVTGYQDPNTMDLVAGFASPTFQDSPRSPINVNTASREVLIALLQPLLTNKTKAAKVADDLMAWRDGKKGPGSGPMSSWQDYEVWWKGVRARTGISAAEEKNLRANANPNRKNAWDKSSSDVASKKFTTEFCFHSGGIYEIECTGETMSKVGVSLAKITVTATAWIFKLWNQTKKRQFRGEDGNFNGVLDAGEDADGNGVLDKPEFRNVTWRDHCPVDSSDERDMGYAPNPQTVNDSLKLGFWENFDEDESASFAAIAWVRANPADSPGATFVLASSDSRNNGKQFRHATSVAKNPANPAAWEKSRYGAFELAYPGYREPYGSAADGSGFADRPAWSFANAAIRVDVLEDDAGLKNDSQSGHDSVAWLSFRKAGSLAGTVYARYSPGIHYFQDDTGDYMASSIYQEPPRDVGMDAAWRADAGGNPYDYRRGGNAVIREEDFTVLPRPLLPGEVISLPGASRLEARLKLPPRVVLHGGTGTHVFGAEASQKYNYFPRRTYHLSIINSPLAGATPDVSPGVYLELAQEKQGGAGEVLRYSAPNNISIPEEGTLQLANHGSFPSWDNIRILTDVGEYQSLILDAGTDHVRWGTLSWTMTIPASADARYEKVFFQPWTFSSRAGAEAHCLNSEPPQGGLQSSGTRIVAEYADPAVPATAHHDQRFLRYKMWLTSERLANHDPKFLKETPVLEDITVTYIPHAKIVSYKEGS